MYPNSKVEKAVFFTYITYRNTCVVFKMSIRIKRNCMAIFPTFKKYLSH